MKLGLVFSLCASWALCFTKFIHPPERDRDQDADQDMTENSQYVDGQIIPILFDTNIKKVDLYLRQYIDVENNASALLKSDIKPDPDGWKAQYDIANVIENKEDSIYWFLIIDSRYNAILAESQYVNVSAPEAGETKTVTVSTAPTTLTTETNTSTTNTSSSEESSSTSKPSSKSELSRGGIAGVSVGATIGGLLILGGIGWMIWRRRARKKNDATPAEFPGNYNQGQPYFERPKSELPAEPVVFSSESPRIPPGIYEAP
ncbi:hypothetical protein FLAG1_10016 [Fusarium langsethiae]|uniref:Mid2 domain-containing protein n=1 Tax=Fusarium langsethiae TaxID=179993 RepID=A0A0N0V5B4_FUSLA|nr:hypothetical protein FLAG1_10016 [Fusarium langsethiae]